MRKVRVLEGVRPVDWVLAVSLTALGVAVTVVNMTDTEADVAAAIADGTMVHPLSTHSVAFAPVFALATIPVLWWRRNVLAVTAIAAAVMVGHDLLFGWETRCGAGLPLAFVLAFLGAYALSGVRLWVSLALVCVLTAAVLVVDATTGPGLILAAVPVVLVVAGIGRAARHRAAMSKALAVRTTELRELRDERVALEVADDRARLSRELDELLQQRLAELETAAEAGRRLGPDAARDQFASIERDSRATLDQMRTMVSVLRGGEVALAPTPTVAHLDALLARRARSDARLTVSGDPRMLPASVELSAYRIVEHLVNGLADRPDAQVEVRVRFERDALELGVQGAVGRTADLKVAVARAQERARLLGGSVDVKVSRGQARAVALLPVTG